MRYLRALMIKLIHDFFCNSFVCQTPFLRVLILHSSHLAGDGYYPQAKYDLYLLVIALGIANDILAFALLWPLIPLQKLALFFLKMKQ
jgi:hypothetical protein